MVYIYYIYWTSLKASIIALFKSGKNPAKTESSCKTLTCIQNLTTSNSKVKVNFKT